MQDQFDGRIYPTNMNMRLRHYFLNMENSMKHTRFLNLGVERSPERQNNHHYADILKHRIIEPQCPEAHSNSQILLFTTVLQILIKEIAILC